MHHSGSAIVAVALCFGIGQTQAFGQSPSAPHWPAEQRFLSDQTGGIALGDLNGDGILDVGATLPKKMGTILFSDGFCGFGLPNDSTHALATTLAGELTFADLDADGDLDRVTTIPNLIAFNAGTLGVEMNDGAGGFFFPTMIPVAAQPQCVRIADLNGDGLPDALCGHTVSLEIHVMLGVGPGAFGVASIIPTPDQTGALEVGDVNADGVLDLVSSGATNDRFNLRFGDGVGGFGALTSYSMGDAPFGLVLADLDGDGPLDVAVSNSNTSTISVRRGQGGGAFAAASTYASAKFSRSLAAGDLDGDGLLDLVAGGEENVAIHRSAGGALFQPATFAATGEAARRVAVADMDGDLRQDVVVANRAVGVMRGDGAGGLLERAETTTLASGMDAAFGDVDGDGFTDIVGVHANEMTVRLCDGAGGFAAPLTTSFAIAEISRPKLRDVDGDGDLDAVVMRSAGVHVLKNDGSGGFTHASQPGSAAATNVVDFNFADVDGDGDADLAFAVSTGAGRIDLLENDGTGSFGAANVVLLPAGIVPKSIDAVFLADADVREDLVIRVGKNLQTTQPGKFYVALGNGMTSFAAVVTVPSITVVERVLVGDVDGDGLPDACVVGTQNGFATSRAVTHLGTGTGALFRSSIVTDLGVVWSIAGGAISDLAGATLADADGDQRPDLALGRDSDGGIAFARNHNGAFETARGFDVDVRGSFVGMGHVDAGAQSDLLVVDRFNPGGPRIGVLRAGCAGGVGVRGLGCAGGGGFVPKLALQGCPSGGETLTLKIRDAFGGPIALLLMGLAPANAQVGGGCSLLVGQLLPGAVTLPLFGVGPGNGTLDANVPLPAAVPAVTLHVQLVSPDPTVGAAFTLSNALSIVFG